MVMKKKEIAYKLELIKSVKELSEKLVELFAETKDSLQLCNKEEDHLRDYNEELEQLLEEKMYHVEKLRLIHADINMLETTIKQADADRRNRLDTARRQHREYLEKLFLTNQMRSNLGLDALSVEQDAALTRSLYESEESARVSSLASKSSTACRNSAMFPNLFAAPPPPAMITSADHDNPDNKNLLHHHQIAAPNYHNCYSSAAKLIGDNNSVGSSTSYMIESGHQRKSLADDLVVPASSNHAPCHSQQPPPMKMCQSCQQQIHRNAPICPLCKAKSRSRNPKKPKRKIIPSTQIIETGTTNSSLIDKD